MSTTTVTATDAPATPVAGSTFGTALRAEWIKLWSVRSTTWTLVALFVLGAGLTVLVCATSASWLASDDADESPLSFVTWGMMLAQCTAVVLGALVITTEYGTGMIRTTLAATPRRSVVVASKALVLMGVLLVAGVATAVVGYIGGNFFLDREGVGVGLGDDGVLRALLGSGLYLAGLGLFALAVGLLVRHTAAAISIVLALVFIVGNMVFLIPGGFGELLGKVMPGNAGGGIATPASFNPDLLGAWAGFAVFVVEVGVLFTIAYAAFRRRDA